MTRPLHSARHNEMLGVLSRYITRPLRETGDIEPTLELLRSLTTAILFMGDKLGKPATETLADLAAGVTEDLARQREGEKGEPQSGGALIPGVDFPDPALKAQPLAGFYGWERTVAGGGTAGLVSGQMYRMRSGSIVVGSHQTSLTKATFVEGATGRRWLLSGHFLAEHIKDDHDLVQRVTFIGAESVA